MSFPNLKKWAYFYISPHFDPSTHTHRHTNEENSCTFISVGFSPSAKKDNSIIEVALKLKEEGVQSIELCGGFGPEWQFKISDALKYEIPVGAVYYGPEYRAKLLHVMKSENN